MEIFFSGLVKKQLLPLCTEILSTQTNAVRTVLRTHGKTEAHVLCVRACALSRIKFTNRNHIHRNVTIFPFKIIERYELQLDYYFF